MSKFAALALAVDKPSRMTIVHPVTLQPLCVLDADGKPTDDVGWIDVYSADSTIARNHTRRFGQKRLDTLARGGRKRKERVEEYEEADIELLVALTHGWRLVGLDGTALDEKCSAENARELYSTPAFAWLRAQVDDFAAERANFSQALSKS